MHVVLTPVGSSGDINPFLAVGRALKERGHDVTLLAPEPFSRPAADTGLEFVSTWSSADYDRVTKDPDLWHPTRGVRLVFRIIGQHLRRGYALLERVYQPGRSVLVGHTLAFPTRVFEEVHDAPAVTIHLAPNVFRSDFRQPVLPPDLDLSFLPRGVKRALWWLIDRFALDPHIVPALNAWRADLGLAPVSRLLRCWIHSPRCVVGLFPPWFGDPQPDWPSQLVMTGFVTGGDSHAPDLYVDQERDGSEARSVLESTDDRPLSHADRPLVFTPGSANRQATSFFQAAIEASERIGHPALLVTAYRDHLPATLPRGVRHVPYAPFTALFSRAAAVIHHGGIGTTAKSLAAGVPQLIMPMGFDQPDNAAHVVRLGVGDRLAPRRFTGSRVAETLKRMLSDGRMKEACEGLRAKLRSAQALARTCEVIEDVADRPSSRALSGSLHTTRR